MGQHCAGLLLFPFPPYLGLLYLRFGHCRKDRLKRTVLRSSEIHHQQVFRAEKVIV